MRTVPEVAPMCSSAPQCPHAMVECPRGAARTERQWVQRTARVPLLYIAKRPRVSSLQHRTPQSGVPRGRARFRRARRASLQGLPFTPPLPQRCRLLSRARERVGKRSAAVALRPETALSSGSMPALRSWAARTRWPRCDVGLWSLALLLPPGQSQWPWPFPASSANCDTAAETVDAAPAADSMIALCSRSTARSRS